MHTHTDSHISVGPGWEGVGLACGTVFHLFSLRFLDLLLFFVCFFVNKSFKFGQGFSLLGHTHTHIYKHTHTQRGRHTCCLAKGQTNQKKFAYS